MQFKSLISSEQLNKKISNPDWVIIDCHYELGDPQAGRSAYLKGHIPGAFYAHLGQDLSGEIIPGKTSRHPLPEIDIFSKKVSAWGIDEAVQVIVYDNCGGAIAARLWWMMKWLGHQCVALLDGGLESWINAGFSLDTSLPDLSPREFQPNLQNQMCLSVEDIKNHHQTNFILIDSRAPERFSGEFETLDLVAGHIPGAVNAHFLNNLDARQKFLSKTVLASKFSEILGSNSHNEAVFYCGSGVTAAHNILAMYHAGLGLAKLYPGSWSEWITDLTRPIQKLKKTNLEEINGL